MYLGDVLAVLLEIGSHVKHLAGIDQVVYNGGIFKGENVRKVAAGAQNCELLRIVADELKLNAGGLLDELDLDVVFVAGGQILRSAANGQGDGILVKAVVVPGGDIALKDLAACKGGNACHQAKYQYKGKNLFHSEASFEFMMKGECVRLTHRVMGHYPFTAPIMMPFAKYF